MNGVIQDVIIRYYKLLRTRDGQGKQTLHRKNLHPLYSKQQIYSLICLEGIDRENQNYLENTIIQGGLYNFLNIPLVTGATTMKFIHKFPLIHTTHRFGR